MFTTRRIHLAILIYFAGLLLLALALPAHLMKPVFGETGPFELGSIVFWLAMTVAVIKTRKHWKPGTWISLAALSLIAAMREADFQKAFTTEGFMKTNYYTNPAIPLPEKMLAGAVFLSILLVAASALYRGARFLYRDRLRTFGSLMLAEIFVLLFITKVCDRLPAIVKKDYDYVPGETLGRILTAVEEGGEMMIPLLGIVTILSVAARAKAASDGDYQTVTG